MESKDDCFAEYERWLNHTRDDVLAELKDMDDAAIEDAFYRELSFGTGGLRGSIGPGTNRMNVYVVAKASQGLVDYLLKKEGGTTSVVVGYDSRIKSDVFARTVACVFAANGICVHMFQDIFPVPGVSYAVRYLRASAGVMITASHNSSKYNGYKVYGADGCQITTEVARDVYACIENLDVFNDVKQIEFDKGVEAGLIRYIDSDLVDSYLDEVRAQCFLYGDEINRDVAIVYSPLNGTGLEPVCKVLSEVGFTNVTVVEEQRNPDGRFPTCPKPNPEESEAMELGLSYCRKMGADLLIATDPDCDRVGIAVREHDSYRLLTANETGILLLDYICSQKKKHGKLPRNGVFLKTIVTNDLAEKIALHYGVKTINTLTGFKYIGEQIGSLEREGCESDFVFGFEESFGYLTGTYVRDKDGVNATVVICEMFAYYKTRGISLIEKLEDVYHRFGYCLNTQYSYEFPGSTGMHRMAEIMTLFRKGVEIIDVYRVSRTDDFSQGLYNLPKSNVIKYSFGDMDVSGSLVVRPSGTEPKLKIYISVLADNQIYAERVERRINQRVCDLINNEESIIGVRKR